MDVYLLDYNFEIAAIVDDYTSLIWRRKYYECGDFELHCSHDLFSVIATEAKYVYRPDRSEVGIIENYGLAYPTSYCKGRFLESMLRDKIIWPQVSFVGAYPSDIALQLIGSLMPDISCMSVPNIGKKITTQVTGDNLAEYLYAMLKTAEASLSLTCDLHTKQLVFSVWQGSDRRISAVFSTEWDNLVSMTYDYSGKDYRNYAIVAGQGEGAARISVTVDNTNGKPRKELFVDARDLQQEEGESLDNYKLRLTQRGIDKLAEYVVVEKCDTQIDTQSNLGYMRDFDLGDICTVTEVQHGISCEKRITECEEAYENGKFSLSVTFGEGYKTVRDYIKRELK